MRAVVRRQLRAGSSPHRTSLDDRPAWAAYFAVALTDPALVGGATNYPEALEGYLAGVVARGQEAGDVAAERSPVMEAVTLLALTNGLTDSVAAGQRSAEEALALLAYRLDRLFSSGGRG